MPTPAPLAHETESPSGTPIPSPRFSSPPAAAVGFAPLSKMLESTAPIDAAVTASSKALSCGLAPACAAGASFAGGASFVWAWATAGTSTARVVMVKRTGRRESFIVVCMFLMRGQSDAPR